MSSPCPRQKLPQDISLPRTPTTPLFADARSSESTHRESLSEPSSGQTSHGHEHYDSDEKDYYYSDGYSSTSATDLIDRELLVARTRHRQSSLCKAWIMSRWRIFRFAPRPCVLLVLLVLSVIQFTWVVLSDSSWTAIDLNRIITSQDDLLSYTHSITINPGASFLQRGSLSRIAQDNRRARRPVPIKSHLEFLRHNAKYLEAWVARGEVLEGLDFGRHDHIDGLWSWVNGSDPRHQAAREFYSANPDTSKLFAESDTAARFRDNGELVYSLRSSRAALGRHLRTMHLMSTDFWPSGSPDELEGGDGETYDLNSTSGPAAKATHIGESDVFHIENDMLRYGQIPQWLQVDYPDIKVGDNARVIDNRKKAPALRMHHDWNLFPELHSVEPETQALAKQSSARDILEYKLAVLPTFNSAAMEASLGVSATDLAEAFFYSNDDFYLGRNLTTADFSSPLYGPAYHIDHTLPLYPNEAPDHGLGEHPSLAYSTWLLGARFGHRERYYIKHVHKTHLRPLILEAQLMFGDEYSITAHQRFRGDGHQMNSHLISYNFVIERHREALLWSYFIARIDKDGSGIYSDAELEVAWSDLGLATGVKAWDQSPTDVRLPARDSLKEDDVYDNFEKSHFSSPRETDFLFSSQDGYSLIVYEKIEDDGAVTKLDRAWPRYDDSDGARLRPNDHAATLNWTLCWDVDIGHNPVELFKHMAFVVPDCGDHLIAILLARSGRKGLSAFLPPPDSTLPRVESLVHKDETTPHLPLNARWQEADYSLEAVATNTGWSGLSRRVFAMMLIQRYSYSIGESLNKFEMLRTPRSAKAALEAMTKAGGRNGYAFMGINDDMEGKDIGETARLFHDWMEFTWPAEQFRLPFEKVPEAPELPEVSEESEVEGEKGENTETGG